MAEPKSNPAERQADNIALREENPDTKDLQFCEACPVNKLLFVCDPQENGILTAVGFSIGPDDASVNGNAHIMISRVLNTNMYAIQQVDNQTMWNRFFFHGKSGMDILLKPLYLSKNEPFYIQIASNFPSGTRVLGNITLYVKPTFSN